VLAVLGMCGTPGPAAAEDISALSRDFSRQLYLEQDVPGAYRKFVDANFWQHDPALADGIAGIEADMQARKADQTSRDIRFPRVDVVDRILVHEDLFVVQHHVFTGPEHTGTAIVDIWRVANGLIVEHWDVIQSVPAVLSNHNTMWCGIANNYQEAKRWRDAALSRPQLDPSCGAPAPPEQSEQSLDVGRQYSMALARNDSRAAVTAFVASDFLQHSPYMSDGREGLVTYLESAMSRYQGGRRSSLTVRTFADGDLVLTQRHVVSPYKLRGEVFIDIFKVKNGKIVEHWDIIQDVPPFTVNGRLMW